MDSRPASDQPPAPDAPAVPDAPARSRPKRGRRVARRALIAVPTAAGVQLILREVVLPRQDRR